ncbi:hypothetical protein FGG08_004148 [Glutinoglossum americanum]|uniref:F-box domain-containing protein n=1 Tax=Glutinoglossum americanum TaxID=1670608 RepID=A0A9P8I5X1_9PEZI|nr:hypothetical protein FGG08_004148 [Glutinoglossum americanum]
MPPQPETDRFDILRKIAHRCSPNKLDGQSLLSVALTCKSWHAVSQSLIYRILDLTISLGRHDSNMRLFQRLENDPELRRKVREIRIRDWLGSGLTLDKGMIQEDLNWLLTGDRPDDGNRSEDTWR